MACPDQNCYDSSPCTDSNPYYENCGCLNPSTFECITKPGSFPYLGIDNTMNGMQVLAALNSKVGYPYVKMTQTARQAMSLTSANIGLHVYQTDNTEGVYVYKSDGWHFAY